jgi:hypothetical protein
MRPARRRRGCRVSLRARKDRERSSSLEPLHPERFGGVSGRWNPGNALIRSRNLDPFPSAGKGYPSSREFAISPRWRQSEISCQNGAEEDEQDGYRTEPLHFLATRARRPAMPRAMMATKNGVGVLFWVVTGTG